MRLMLRWALPFNTKDTLYASRFHLTGMLCALRILLIAGAAR
jgi:hypothetical protein